MHLIHHLNCGTLQAPPYPAAACHCVLIEDDGGLTLVDTGIGLLDVQRPEERIGRELIELAGFQFHEDQTALRQIEAMGYQAEDVKHIVLTHADPDHTGGLADFPDATVHLSADERAALEGGNPRYLAGHFAHVPRWKTYAAASRHWFGLDAHPVDRGTASDLLLISLPGHTLGHCGVAIATGSTWLLHVGDAYYLRVELDRDDHPVSALTAARADDDSKRKTSLEQLRRLSREHRDEIELFGYHDFEEFPPPQDDSPRVANKY